MKNELIPHMLVDYSRLATTILLGLFILTNTSCTIQDTALGDHMMQHTVSTKGSERATQGTGCKLVTRNGKTHIVWQDSTGPEEYVNRIRTFDHETGEFGEIHTINEPVDNHARPNILMDHEGYLHLVISGHNSPVTYQRSINPNDSSEWTNPTSIGEGTYPAPAIGPDGTIYVLMRSANQWNGDDLYVKPKGKPWRKQCKLVYRDPEMPGYAAFHGQPVVGADGTVHVVIHFYEGKGIFDRRGLHQAICYMKSSDHGKTWSKADGSPVDVPARPADLDVIARDRATARHEDKPPPLFKQGGLVLDEEQRPHILYCDHRVEPGQIMHAMAQEDGRWTRGKIEAPAKLFEQFRATTISNLQSTPDGKLIALVEFQPYDDMWDNGLPTRKMNMKTSREKRLGWVISGDAGITWTSRKALRGGDFNSPNLEEPTGGNQLPEDRLPPMVYFDGASRYPEEGEALQNNVYLAVPESTKKEKQETFPLHNPRAREMLGLTPGMRRTLRRAHNKDTLEIAPVHLPQEGSAPLNHFGWPIATRSGDTIIVMHRRIPGHHPHRGAENNPDFSYGIVLRSEDGGQTWSEAYDLRDCMKPEDRNRGGIVPLSHRSKFDPDNESQKGYKVHLHAIGTTRDGAVVAINNHGVFRSKDKGKTWKHFSKALREDTFPHEIVNLGPRIIDHPEHGLLAFGNWVTQLPSKKLVVLQSQDGGATWKVHQYPVGVSQYEPAALHHDGKIRFLTRNQDTREQHEQMAWTPWETPEVLDCNLNLGSVDTVDLSFNPVTKRYEVAYSERNRMQVSLWSMNPEKWDSGEWRRECQLIDTKGTFYRNADGFHTGGAVIDPKRNVQHIFLYRGMPEGPSGIFRITRSLNTPELRESIMAEATYRNRDSWRAAVPERYRDRESFAWPNPDPDLPNVLLIGDSISMLYTQKVRKHLSNLANVYRAPANCRSTRQTLEEIESYLGDKKWDVIHFNWGIHDVTRVGPDGQTDPEGTPQVPLKAYRKNLQRLVRRLKATGAELVWGSTTPVARDVGIRKNADIEACNEAARKIMERHYIPVNDLHKVVQQAGKKLWHDGVHFGEEGSDILAREVAQKIVAQLANALALEPILNTDVEKLKPSDADVSKVFGGDQKGTEGLQQVFRALPLSNRLFPSPVRVSVEPAPDNGDGWRITAQPAEMQLSGGESRRILLRASAQPHSTRYPLPDIFLKVETASRTGDDTLQRTVRKQLDVIGTQPEMNVQKTKSAPAVNGALEKSTWQKPDVPVFGRMDGKRDVTPKTSAWIRYDRKALYLAFRCQEPSPQKLKRAARKRDDRVFLDDSVEVMLDPAANGKTYYQIVVNTAGVIYDGEKFDKSVDLEGVEIGTQVGKDAWSAEIAIPWSEIGQDGPPEQIKFLLCRNRQVSGEHEVFQFPVSPEGNHKPSMFAIGSITNK